MLAEACTSVNIAAFKYILALSLRYLVMFSFYVMNVNNLVHINSEYQHVFIFIIFVRDLNCIIRMASFHLTQIKRYVGSLLAVTEI